MDGWRKDFDVTGLCDLGLEGLGIATQLQNNWGTHTEVGILTTRFVICVV